MEYRTWAWGRSRPRLYPTPRWQEEFWGLGLFLVALLLLSLNLGNIPLFHPQEVTFAQLGREIFNTSYASWQSFEMSLQGVPPEMIPPLLPHLIAVAYALGGIHEWTTRLPGVLVVALSVPGLYWMGRELFPTRLAAVMAALSYLTLSPLGMTGRWVGLEGVGVAWEILTLYWVLRSRRDLRWCLAVGLGVSGLCLTQGLWGLSLLGVILCFLGWDTPRLLQSVYLWLGLGLGFVPMGAWYWTQGGADPLQFLQRLLGEHFLPISGYPSSILVVYMALPGLLFGAYCLIWSKEQWHWGWAKLVWVWLGVEFMGFLLPPGMELLPLFPPLCLAMGAQLAEFRSFPENHVYPKILSILFGLLGLTALGGSLYFAFFDPLIPAFRLIFAAIALTLAITALLLERQDIQFPILFFWGMYVSFILLVMSPHWLPTAVHPQSIKPMATVLQMTTTPETVIFTSFKEEEAALEFYSDRTLEVASISKLHEYWHTATHPYLLVDDETLSKLDLDEKQYLGQVTSYGVLITKPVSSHSSE